MVLITFSEKYASHLGPEAHFSGASVFVTFGTLCSWCPHHWWEHTFQQNQLLALGENHMFVEVALEISQTPPGGARKRLQLCISAFLHLCIRAFLHTAQLASNSRSTHAQLALNLRSNHAQLTVNSRSTHAQLICQYYFIFRRKWSRIVFPRSADWSLTGCKQVVLDDVCLTGSNNKNQKIEIGGGFRSFCNFRFCLTLKGALAQLVTGGSTPCCKTKLQIVSQASTNGLLRSTLLSAVLTCCQRSGAMLLEMKPRALGTPAIASPGCEHYFCIPVNSRSSRAQLALKIIS